uniref:Uncharacterized protein n=1 Tax=Erpetoichthys calabaricus TaxID=27687 RepID=A0A8C4RI59_ERPCA
MCCHEVTFLILCLFICICIYLFIPDEKDAILEPLSLPESQSTNTPVKIHTSVSCILCEENFMLSAKDVLLKHFVLEHKLVIADVKLIADFRR